MVTRAGFTITEVVVAMTLLAVAALGVAATALVAVQSFSQAELQERSIREAEQVLDSLLLQPANSAGARQIGPARISWPASDTSATVTVRIAVQGRTITLAGAR